MNDVLNDAITDIVSRRVKILDEVNHTFALSKEQLREYQLHKVKETLLHVYQNNEFYKGKLTESNISWNDIKALSEFSALPFTIKEEIKSQYPFGLLSASHDEIVRYGESTGTTGDPINSYYTGDDWFANNCIVATLLSNLITNQDTVAVIVPYGLALVGQDIDRALELIGAKTIAIGMLSSACPVERSIKILKDTETTTLVCSPSRALYISEEAMKLGYDLKNDFKIKKILCVGEGTSIEKAKAIKEAWGADAYPLYGMTETNTIAMSCQFGKMHIVENKLDCEIIDASTGEVLGDDVRGELVVTSFGKAMPLIRYRTGDLCTIHSQSCACGSTFRFLEHHGRITDSIVMGDRRIQLLDLEAIILSASGTKFFTLKIKGDELIVGLVLSKEECQRVERDVMERLKIEFNIISSVVPVDGEQLIHAIKNKVKPSISSILQDGEK
ncbi:phenylacetate--CoA ligase family protein [Paenibacillus sp. NPDC057934]|uniref:phenylacetate--CoA ligase family protein n=1 Tax=Paenibacillus sp. NPDC057934 TaxID=3346282 RepID=UPI0036D95278